MALHRSLPTGADGGVSPWLGYLVFGLDRLLRRWQDVYEFTDKENCLFRIQRGNAEENLTLSDGTHVVVGDPILILHLWNEHLHMFARKDPTIAWARQISRAIDASLRELAHYLAGHPLLDDVVALRADLRLGAADCTERLVDLAARFGFEESTKAHESESTLHRIGDNILVFLLVMASNPAAIRVPSLLRDQRVVYFSRRALERRYGTDESRKVQAERPC